MHFYILFFILLIIRFMMQKIHKVHVFLFRCMFRCMVGAWHDHAPNFSCPVYLLQFSDGVSVKTSLFMWQFCGKISWQPFSHQRKLKRLLYFSTIEHSFYISIYLNWLLPELYHHTLVHCLFNFDLNSKVMWNHSFGFYVLHWNWCRFHFRWLVQIFMIQAGSEKLRGHQSWLESPRIVAVLWINSFQLKCQYWCLLFE